MTSGHLEVETKYDVDEGFAVPDLSGLDGVATVDAPVEHLLEAVYLDTEDLRLLRARITLRRRTGGTDAGWHLKLPAGTARRELHAPLGRATKKAPRALQEPVAGVLRGATGAAGGHAADPARGHGAARGRREAARRDRRRHRERDPPRGTGGRGGALDLARGRGGARRGRRGAGRGGGGAAGRGGRPALGVGVQDRPGARRPARRVAVRHGRPRRADPGGVGGGVPARHAQRPGGRPPGGRRHAAHRAARRRPPGPGGCPSAAQHAGGVPPADGRDHGAERCGTSCRGSAGSSPTPGTPRWRWSTCATMVAGRARGAGARAGRRPSPADGVHGGPRRPRPGPAHAVGAAVPPPARRPARLPRRPAVHPGGGGAAPAGPPRHDPAVGQAAAPEAEGGAAGGRRRRGPRRCTRSARPRSGPGTRPRSARASSPTSRRWPAPPSRCRRCWGSSRTPWSPASSAAVSGSPRRPRGRTPSPTAGCTASKQGARPAPRRSSGRTSTRSGACCEAAG